MLDAGLTTDVLAVMREGVTERWKQAGPGTSRWRWGDVRRDHGHRTSDGLPITQSLRRSGLAQGAPDSNRLQVEGASTVTAAIDVR